jgi:lipoic acid synthetase
MDVLAAAKPFVVAQNMETVKRLTHKVRDIRAGYQKTLQCLDYYKKQHGMRTKTSLMVGLGETMEELEECMDDLQGCGGGHRDLRTIFATDKKTP